MMNSDASALVVLTLLALGTFTAGVHVAAWRNLSTAEPVSAPPKWKWENGEQRPAPETLAQRTKMPEIAGQRLAPASLTRGKINDFHRPGKISQETELRGWGTWIRTKIDGVRWG